MALLIFTITIFVSAFLLFLVQPLVGKLILPKLGGTPQVWNTCMVFFQSVLLAGYAYTHSTSTRLKLRQQLVFHCVLLLLPIVVMLLFPMYGYVQNWNPPTEGNPIPMTLLLLATIIGLPFFVVSTSAPLLQKWFGFSGHETAKDPYFLYSASNAGSLLSLLLYPVLIEPFTVLPSQTWIWFGGYIALAGLICFCAYTIYKSAPPDMEILAAETAASAPPPPSPEMPAPAVDPAPVSTALKSGPAPGARGIQRKKGTKAPVRIEDEKAPELVVTGAKAEMTTWRRIRWVLLAAVPSSLMLGVTSYISTDLSPFPLVWIIPLALYLLSFILVYSKFRYKGLVIDWSGRRLKVFGPPGYTLHEMTIYLFEVLGLLGLSYVAIIGGREVGFPTFCIMMGFFTVALACHGELALDRPDTKHLTEYFLLMSFGGMVGGVLNGIIAPIVFQHGVLEFYIALVVACFVRPEYVRSGWLDELILNAFPKLQLWVTSQGNEFSKSMGRRESNTTYPFSYLMDVLLGLFVLGIAYWLNVKVNENLEGIIRFTGIPATWATLVYKLLVYGVPMIFAFFFAGRPLRFSLAIAGILLANVYFLGERTNVIESRRTYFGLLRVMKSTTGPRDEEEQKEFIIRDMIEDGKRYIPPFNYTYLIHGTTYHGQNFIYNNDIKKAGYIRDLSRLATTYYHRYGPVGPVMERYNWFPGPQNSFAADVRGPASLIGELALAQGMRLSPITSTAYAEPPYATIGLGTGTMASYSRPFQHLTYYEIDEVIRGFSLPEDDSTPYFTYLQNAIKRGVNLEVIMGDARQSLQHDADEKKYEEFYMKNSLLYSADWDKSPGEVNKPVHNKSGQRQKYYKVIVVDAFSSDAIPIHLCTKQAIQLYMDHLADDGVLCMHTSNKHMDLVFPVVRIALELGLSCKIGKDSGVQMGGRRSRDSERYMGFSGSEYVMIYRGEGSQNSVSKEKYFPNYLEALKTRKEDLIKKNVMKPLKIEGYKEESWPYGRAPAAESILNSVVEWNDPKDHGHYERTGFVRTPITKADSLWTDDYSNILGVIRWHSIW